MKIKLLPTLWLLGGVLYAGSTVFLAHAVLGGPGGKQAVASASDAQCQKDSAAAVQPDAPKTAAVTPDKGNAPKQPQDAATKQPSAAKPDAADAENSSAQAIPTPDGDDADQDQASDQDQQGADQNQAALDQHGDDQAGPGAEADQAGSQPQANEGEGEWAKVIAGTADMRSEPSLQSQLVYALPAGWQVRVIARQPGWVQVQDANSGASGWVEASAVAPMQSPSDQKYGGQAPGYGQGPGYGPGYGPPPPGYGYPGRYAEDGYPEDPRWRRRDRRGELGDFLRRALGGF